MNLMRETLREVGWRADAEYTDERLRDRMHDIWVILDFCKTVGIPRSI